MADAHGRASGWDVLGGLLLFAAWLGGCALALYLLVRFVKFAWTG